MESGEGGDGVSAAMAAAADSTPPEGCAELAEQVSINH